jgi:mRNA-degrading endonuclease RelE of RelBE toxin-antitoxin system
MIDLKKKIQELTAEELRELKDESDSVVKAVHEFQNKIHRLSMNKESDRALPKDFRGRDGAIYRWKEMDFRIAFTEKVNDAVVE